MAELRVRRAAFPEAIGRRVHEINFRDEEIEDALNALEKALANGKDDAKALLHLGMQFYLPVSTILACLIYEMKSRKYLTECSIYKCN